MNIYMVDKLVAELDKVLEEHYLLCKALGASLKTAKEIVPDEGPCWAPELGPITGTLRDTLKELESTHLGRRIENVQAYLQERYSAEAQVAKLQVLLNESEDLFKDLSSEATDQSNYKVKRLFEELKEIINDNSGTWNIPERKENDNE